MKKQSKSIYFKEKLEKLPETNWQNKVRKHQHAIFAKENCNKIIF